MKRRTINPWTWQEQFGFAQAVEVSEAHRMLIVSGQTSINAEGSVDAIGDMRGQVMAAINNLETVLHEAGMRLEDLVRINFYTTDMDRFLAESHEVLATRLGNVTYATTYLGVTALALPDLLVECDATAVAAPA
jgi:enamine deaminase RidA (YjgF/YER057c/UK114 family)